VRRAINNSRRGSLVLLALAVAGFVAVARADREDEIFLDGLRDRRLFSLAEAYCRDRLAEPDLSVADRAELVIELSQTKAQHALNTAPADRGPLWQASRQVVAEFLRDHPQNPRLILVRLQDALTVLARGELARQEAELGAAGAPSVEEAREQLRAAASLLTELKEDAAELLRKRHRDGRPGEGELTANELVSLGNNIQYQLARAYRNQALCYGADTADRANSLTQAAAQLEPLSRRDTADPLTWSARIDAVTCARLLGDLPGATRRVDAVLAATPPIPVVLAARAEKIRMELAAGKPEAALNLLKQGRELGGMAEPDLDYAMLETFIALWQAAAKQRKTEDARRWQEQAAKMVRLIERVHGPYWLRRAETLLAHSASESDTGNVELLVRAAENLYLRGDLDEAVARYDQAARLEAAAGRSDQAFDLWFKAAAIEHQRLRRPEAMRRFRDLARALPDQPGAAKAHLLAILNVSAIVRDTDPPDVGQYEALLQEHLNMWPSGSGGDQARWWLGRLCEHRRNWPDALAAYTKISAGFPQYEDAFRAIVRCWRAQLSEQAAAGELSEQDASAAARWFEAVVRGDEGRLPEQFSGVQREAAVAAAEIWLTYTSDGFSAARAVLQAALKGAGDAPQRWRSEAQMLLVVALAGQGQRGEALQLLRQVSGGDPARMLHMTTALRNLTKRAPVTARRDLAKIQLEATDLAASARDKLSAVDRKQLDLSRGEALAAAGLTDRALTLYQELASAHSDDGEIQEAYAQLLLDAKDRDSLEKALTQWHKVSHRSPPESDRWYRAKYGLAQTHYELGNKQRAVTLIQYLETLHPELGGDALRPKFRELLARCQKE
jgi:tetratricopeptide (TPR) repeat protein